MKTRMIDLLVFLMKTDGKECPPKFLLPIDEKKLLTVAKKNKSFPFLFHLLNCPSCKRRIKKNTLKKLSNYQKFVSVWSLLYQNEKKQIGKFCQKSKIKAVLIKDFSSYPKMAFHQKFLMGVDLDLLVKENDIIRIESFLKNRGYRLEKYLILKNKNGKIYYQEKNLFHPQKKVSIDLHPQLAIPHEDEFNFLSWQLIKDVSEEIFQNLIQQKNGLSIPKKEYFLLSLLIHYMGSDILKGLRNLFDIIQFANFYEQEINWKKTLQLCKQFKILNFSYFIFLLGSNIFNLSLPQSLQGNIQVPPKVRFLAFCWPVEKVALFPPIVKWHLGHKKTLEIFYENFFLKLLLADSVTPWRLIRPRVFLFCLKAGLYRLNKAVSHLHQKSSLLKPIQHQPQESVKKDSLLF